MAPFEYGSHSMCCLSQTLPIPMDDYKRDAHVDAKVMRKVASYIYTVSQHYGITESDLIARILNKACLDGFPRSNDEFFRNNTLFPTFTSSTPFNSV